MNILIAEDNKPLCKEIKKYCECNSHNVVFVYDGILAVEEIEKNNFDLYILDINLPSMNGLDIIKYIRSTDIDTPIIIITASDKLETIQNAYAYGCNEYIKKPFFLQELEIRIRNVVTKKIEKCINFADDFYYNMKENNFYHNDKIIELRYKEKRFINLLMKNIGSVVKNSLIHDYVWESDIKDNYPLRQLVAELRRKLPLEIIITKPKEGYLVENDIVENESTV
ncbi:MAG: DNA-binding response regulator [Epsilonproteobacteria bacterium]|nr:MAG: DNA-binding response regulator [Campylobacterota bacterium]